MFFYEATYCKVFLKQVPSVAFPPAILSACFLFTSLMGTTTWICIRSAASFLSHGNMTSLNTLCFENHYCTEGTMMQLVKRVILTRTSLFPIHHHAEWFEGCCLLASLI